MKNIRKNRAFWIIILTTLILILAVITIPAFKFQARVRGLLQRAEILPAALPEYMAPIAPVDRVTSRRLLVTTLHEAIQDRDFEEAARLNAILSQEAFQRTFRTIQAWENERDPQNGLIPYATAHGYAYWNGKDNAADLFSHILIGALYLDPNDESTWMETFRNEAELCGSMSCRVDLETGNLIETDLDSLIFDTAEYAKDGLLPMVERFGPGPWLERLTTVTDAILETAYVESTYGNLPSIGTEVNGEMLQVLTRLYWLTEEERYLEMAERIGNAYLLEAIPNNNGLPADYWDFTTQNPLTEDARFRPAVEHDTNIYPFRLVDHGGEIIPGLAELYFLEKKFNLPLAETYYQPLQDFLDKILVTGRRSDGLWYNSFDSISGQVIDQNLADTWGYLLNAYQTFDLANGKDDYADEIQRTMQAAAAQHSIQWEGNFQDGYADSIESMLYLLPWHTQPEYQKWVDEEIEVLFLKQQDNGFIENWYLDGNFIRTALLYGFYKTQGIRIEPWREDVRLGAAYDETDNELYLYLAAENPWEGRIIFDSPRHNQIWNMPSDYPRLNQLPEWHTVISDNNYTVVIDGGNGKTYNGQELIEGIHWQLPASGRQFIHLLEEK